MLQTIKMSASKFSLQWNDFETNITDALKELREEKDFFDVTIACEDSQIQAHKVILSACSTFFRNVLRRNPHQHPLLYLKGVKYKEFISILNFMYNGEVNVAQEELKQFLEIAEDLKVKGLTQKMGIPSQQNTSTTASATITKSQQTPIQSNNMTEIPIAKKRESSDKIPANKRLRPSVTTTASTKEIVAPVRTYQHVEDDEILEVVPVQPVVKESPKPAAYKPTSPQKQEEEPPMKILEQCILEADINNEKDQEDVPVIVKEKTKKPLILIPRKGSNQTVSTPVSNGKTARPLYPGLSISKAKPVVRPALKSKEYIVIEDITKSKMSSKIRALDGSAVRKTKIFVQGSKTARTAIITSPVKKVTNTITKSSTTPVKILPRILPKPSNNTKADKK